MRIVLVGAGDHGRGTLEILRARAAAGLHAPEVIGFVDDNPALADKLVGGIPVLGNVEWLAQRSGQFAAILSLAGARAKQKIAERLDSSGVLYTNAIHPSVNLGVGLHVGPGAIINAGVAIAYDTLIGRHTTVNLNATIGHDCEIGDLSTIAPGVNITGKVKVGIGVEIQTNATIVPGLKLGDFCQVGPGSVVLRDVEPGESVFGNPARRMPKVPEGHL